MFTRSPAAMFGVLLRLGVDVGLGVEVIFGPAEGVALEFGRGVAVAPFPVAVSGRLRTRPA